MDQTQVSDGLGAQQLLDALKESSLLSPEEMNRATILVLDSGLQGRALGMNLVKAGFVTPYQLDALYKRQFAELRIGNYIVLDRLGAGGMGTVYKARHRRMKRVVALKVLTRDLAKDETFLQRFQREVEMIARFTHPNIVMAYDADEDAAGPYLVMEFVDGQDLASIVSRQGPLAVSAAVDAILQAARGLEYSHGQGIIHRDIKPANLLRDNAGTVKVTDLGLARFSSLAAEGLPAGGAITQAGGIVGTVDYMSPEQAVDSSCLDHRSDIYSLGATLYFLLAGRPPYQGTTMMGTLLKHRDEPIPSLTGAAKDVPAALDAVFRRMMAKAPTDRFQSMTEVVRTLEAVAAGLGGPRPAEASGSATAATWQGLDTRVAPASNLPSTTVEVKPGSTPQGASTQLLLVEPSRTQSSIIRNYLQGQGVHDIVSVASGKEALEAVGRARPAAIISALHLADSMTGVQLAEQVRTQCKDEGPGFVLISSKAESADIGSLSHCSGTMVLHKPFSPEQLAEALRFVTQKKSSGAFAGRVLIVDDSAAARLHMRDVLGKLGVTQIAEAPDGAQAVALLARQSFDLIVTDYNMPYMDGRGLVGYLKQNPQTAAIPIVMVTTEQDPAKLDAVRQLGVTAICDKSFPADLVRRILDQLASTS
jgi:serine/threonine-protein kinase